MTRSGLVIANLLRSSFSPPKPTTPPKLHRSCVGFCGDALPGYSRSWVLFLAGLVFRGEIAMPVGPPAKKEPRRGTRNDRPHA